MYAVRWAKMAALYFAVGSTMGLVMGIMEVFQYAPAHAHINLLGWASMGLIALLYRAFPVLEQSKLAAAHFWVYQVGILLFTFCMWGVIYGLGAAAALIPIAGTLALLGVLLTTVLVWTGLKAPAGEGAGQSQAS